MKSPWDEVWECRASSTASTSTLMSLLTLDGYDTGFGSVTEENFIAMVQEVVHRLDLTSADSVFEVGCGAGGFLYDLYRQGFEVAGIDRSVTLVEHARQAISGGRFSHSDAAQFDIREPYDAVVSFSVFQYFPSYSYAQRVIEGMAQKARKVVAILDIPDLAKQSAAMAKRIEGFGGEDAYAKHYTGLDHLYFDRTWVIKAMADCGLTGIQTASQWLKGYENSQFRFNAWGFWHDR